MEDRAEIYRDKNDKNDKNESEKNENKIIDTECNILMVYLTYEDIEKLYNFYEDQIDIFLKKNENNLDSIEKIYDQINNNILFYLMGMIEVNKSKQKSKSFLEINPSTVKSMLNRIKDAAKIKKINKINKEDFISIASIYLGDVSTFDKYFLHNNSGILVGDREIDSMIGRVDVLEKTMGNGNIFISDKSDLSQDRIAIKGDYDDLYKDVYKDSECCRDSDKDVDKDCNKYVSSVSSNNIYKYDYVFKNKKSISESDSSIRNSADPNNLILEDLYDVDTNTNTDADTNTNTDTNADTDTDTDAEDMNILKRDDYDNMNDDDLMAELMMNHNKNKDTDTDTDNDTDIEESPTLREIRIGVYRLLSGAAYRVFRPNYSTENKSENKVEPYLFDDFVDLVRETTNIVMDLRIVPRYKYVYLERLNDIIQREYRKVCARVEHCSSHNCTPSSCSKLNETDGSDEINIVQSDMVGRIEDLQYIKKKATFIKNIDTYKNIYKDINVDVIEKQIDNINIKLCKMPYIDFIKKYSQVLLKNRKNNRNSINVGSMLNQSMRSPDKMNANISLYMSSQYTPGALIKNSFWYDEFIPLLLRGLSADLTDDHWESLIDINNQKIIKLIDEWFEKNKSDLLVHCNDLVNIFTSLDIREKIMMKRSWDMIKDYMIKYQIKLELKTNEERDLSQYVPFIDVLLNRSYVRDHEMRLTMPYFIGPPIWTYLHSIPELLELMIGSEEITDKKKIEAEIERNTNNIKKYILLFLKMYPCPYCRHHINDFVKVNNEIFNYPLEYILLGFDKSLLEDNSITDEEKGNRLNQITDIFSLNINRKLGKLKSFNDLRLFLWKFHNAVSSSIKTKKDNISDHLHDNISDHLIDDTNFQDIDANDTYFGSGDKFDDLDFSRDNRKMDQNIFTLSKMIDSSSRKSDHSVHNENENHIENSLGEIEEILRDNNPYNSAYWPPLNGSKVSIMSTEKKIDNELMSANMRVNYLDGVNNLRIMRERFIIIIKESKTIDSDNNIKNKISKIEQCKKKIINTLSLILIQIQELDDIVLESNVLNKRYGVVEARSNNYEMSKLYQDLRVIREMKNSSSMIDSKTEKKYEYYSPKSRSKKNKDNFPILSPSDDITNKNTYYSAQPILLIDTDIHTVVNDARFSKLKKSREFRGSLQTPQSKSDEKYIFTKGKPDIFIKKSKTIKPAEHEQIPSSNKDINTNTNINTNINKDVINADYKNNLDNISKSDNMSNSDPLISDSEKTSDSSSEIPNKKTNKKHRNIMKHMKIGETKQKIKLMINNISSKNLKEELDNDNSNSNRNSNSNSTSPNKLHRHSKAYMSLAHILKRKSDVKNTDIDKDTDKDRDVDADISQSYDRANKDKELYDLYMSNDLETIKKKRANSQSDLRSPPTSPKTSPKLTLKSSPKSPPPIIPPKEVMNLHELNREEFNKKYKEEDSNEGNLSFAEKIDASFGDSRSSGPAKSPNLSDESKSNSNPS